MNSLLLAQAVHVIFCAGLYALLTVARAPNVWGIGKRADGTNPFSSIQPKISANLSNQFEWPLFFHVICILLLMTDQHNLGLYSLLAWVFIGGRILHSAVQIGTENIRLRGAVFTLNFLAVLGMWVVFVIELLSNR